MSWHTDAHRIGRADNTPVPESQPVISETRCHVESCFEPASVVHGYRFSVRKDRIRSVFHKVEIPLCGTHEKDLSLPIPGVAAVEFVARRKVWRG